MLNFTDVLLTKLPFLLIQIIETKFELRKISINKLFKVRDCAKSKDVVKA